MSRHGAADARALEARGARRAPRVTVLVPVFDEAERIGAVVADVVRALERFDGDAEVLVLNDGSTDWSPELEQRLVALGPVRLRSSYPNRGKGAVLSAAFPRLASELTVVIDADGEYSASDIPAVLAPLLAGEADWVMGSRYGFGRRRPRQYLLTYAVNRAINLWFRWLSGRPTRDLLTGLYAFRTKLVRGLRLREPRFSYTAELVWRLQGHPGLRWTEVPIAYRFRRYAEGKKIRWWETGTILLALLRYRFRGRRARD